MISSWVWRWQRTSADRVDGGNAVGREQRSARGLEALVVSLHGRTVDPLPGVSCTAAAEKTDNSAVRSTSEANAP